MCRVRGWAVVVSNSYSEAVVKRRLTKAAAKKAATARRKTVLKALRRRGVRTLKGNSIRVVCYSTYRKRLMKL